MIHSKTRRTQTLLHLANARKLHNPSPGCPQQEGLSIMAPLTSTAENRVQAVPPYSGETLMRATSVSQVTGWAATWSCSRGATGAGTRIRAARQLTQDTPGFQEHTLSQKSPCSHRTLAPGWRTPDRPSSTKRQAITLRLLHKFARYSSKSRRRQNKLHLDPH